MASTEAHVTPGVLRWAREAVRMTLEDAARSIDVAPERLAAAEEGERRLTMRKAERAAEVYGVGTSVLFRPTPPEEEPEEALFRRLPGAPAPPWPGDMVKLSRTVRARQQAAVELHEDLGLPFAWPERLEELRVDAHVLASVLRGALGVTEAEQLAFGYDKHASLRRFVRAVEELGIMVMQDGRLPAEAMRGFALLHDRLPAVVLNSSEDPRSRVFTLVHEVGHQWLAATGHAPVDEERWLEGLAGEVLMPELLFRRQAAPVRQGREAAEADRLGRAFGVTPRAAAVRMVELGYIDRAQYREVVRALELREPYKANGGNYYLNKLAWLGPSYIRLVLEGVDGQALTLAGAARLLGAKVDHFGRLRDEADKRVAG